MANRVLVHLGPEVLGEDAPGAGESSDAGPPELAWSPRPRQKQRVRGGP